MAFQNFQVGCKAEAVDDDGVWCRCTVILNENDGVTVSFDGWKSEWNRKICDASQIRTQTAVSGKGKRKHVALSSENPQILKTVKGDMLWLGETEALVTEVDPIRGMIRVTMGADLEVQLRPEELTKRKPQEEGEERKKKKTKDRKEGKEIAEKEIMPPTTPPTIPTAPPAIPASGDLEFSVFISPDGTVLKIGALCFVESLTIPILITRLFKSTISGKLFVSGVRCSCEGGKILSLLQNFQVTVECLFVCPCSSSQFSMSSNVSSEVNLCVFRGQSRVCGCQERNFGNVHYLRDLRRHALGAQMRQAVSSGISLHATRPAQPISLGTFDPFSDMAIFGLSEMNNFRIPFSVVGGYSVLDSIMGKGWDVKPLRSDVDNCHFKYVSLFTVYLDKKNFILKCSFSYSEAPFSLSPDYREKCKALSQ